MSRIFLGLILISASLQTAWALLSDGLMLVLPLVAASFYIGFHYLRRGCMQLQNRRA